MNIAIVGSRKFPGLISVWRYVQLLPDGCNVVSGGARGVDSVGENSAIARGWNPIIFHADWESFGKGAGYRRNIDIIKAADVVVAFWYNQSKGTQHSMDLALQRGKPLIVFVWEDGKIKKINYESSNTH